MLFLYSTVQYSVQYPSGSFLEVSKAVVSSGELCTLSYIYRSTNVFARRCCERDVGYTQGRQPQVQPLPLERHQKRGLDYIVVSSSRYYPSEERAAADILHSISSTGDGLVCK